MKKTRKTKSKFKNIIGMLNIPLIILLLIVGGLLLVAQMKSEPIITAKQKVSNTVNEVSKTLNDAANSSDNSNS